MAFGLKRIHDKPSKTDGLRVLVDRVWPRGISKDKAKVDLWVKDIAPSTSLRKWFRHDPEKWDEFKKRYFQELGGQSHMLQKLVKTVRRRRVTLLFAAKDWSFNNAAALKEHLED